MADQEPKDVPSTNEELVESAPQDPNTRQKASPAISVTGDGAVQDAEDAETIGKFQSDIYEDDSERKLDELDFDLEQLLHESSDDDEFQEIVDKARVRMSVQLEATDLKEGDGEHEETGGKDPKKGRRLSIRNTLTKESEQEIKKMSEEDSAERAQLMEQYQQCILTRDQLTQQNAVVQQKLVKFFKMKKTDDSCTDAKNVAELEQRYLKLMAQIEELQVEQEAEKTAQMYRTNELEQQYNEKKNRVESDQRKLQDMKKHVAQQAINSRSGKPISDKDIEQYMASEEKKDMELDNVRLENIKLKNRLKKKELQRKAKEGLAEGLRLIDFEQLKIENQTYNEKIEERIEELHKLDKKIKNTAEVQTHMTEKLQCIQIENDVLSKELMEIETQVAQKRDELSRTKQLRDALKRSNSSLHKNCGLLGNRLLLRNFEDQKDENDRLLKELENLKMTFADYTMQAKQVQQKINQATQKIRYQH